MSTALPGASEPLATMRNVFPDGGLRPQTQASAMCQATLPTRRTTKLDP